jgi:hypothetical protein
MLSVELMVDMLFVALVMVASGLSWHSGKTDSTLVVGFGWPAEKVRGKMENNADGVTVITWCD